VKNEKNEKKNILVFGYGLAIICAFFSFRSWSHQNQLGLILCGLASVCFALVTAVKWECLKSFYTQWMKVAHFIGNIISTIVLCVIFYLVFGLVGIVLRLLRKDFLECKIEKDRESYWIKREEAAFDKMRYTKAF